MDIENARSRIDALAAHQPPIECLFSSLGIFPGPPAVVFVAPVVTGELLEFNRRCHMVLSDCATGPWEHYLPGHWVPHCTLAQDLPPERAAEAIEQCGRLVLPFRAMLAEIGIVEFRPVKHRYAARFQTPAAP